MITISGYNSSVGQTKYDIIPRNSALPLPTLARIHALVSDNVEDNNTYVKQIETATVAGTIGAAGAGNVKTTVTSALLDEPFEFLTAVANNDTASQVAGKIRVAAATHTEITTLFTISGATDKFILTQKIASADDVTFNIAIDNDTSVGLTAAPTSANTTTGHIGTGARTILVTGVLSNFSTITEVVNLNGTTSVNTVNAYLYLDLQVETAGSLGVNVGVVTATAATEGTITNQIQAGDNKTEQAIFIGENGKDYKIKNFSLFAYNSTAGAYTTVRMLTKKQGGVFLPVKTILLNSDLRLYEKELFAEINGADIVKFDVVNSAGTSIVKISFDVE